MADKDLKIQITTAADTAGADAAAASLEKVRAAAKSADTGGSRYTGADELLAKMDVMKDRATDLEAQAANAEALGNSAEAAAPKLDKLIGFERVRAIGEMGREIERFAKQMAKLNPETEESAKLYEAAGGALAGFSEGMRMGGPAVGVMIGAISLLKLPFDEIVKSLDAYDKIQRDVEKSTLAMATAHINHAREVALADVAGLYDRETESLKRLLQTQEVARAVDAAARKATAAERDANDDDAIRKGASPYAVKIARARQEEAEAVKKVDADLEMNRKALAEKERILAIAEGDLHMTNSLAVDESNKKRIEAEKKRLEAEVERLKKEVEPMRTGVEIGEKTRDYDISEAHSRAAREINRQQAEQARADEANDRRKADEAIRAQNKAAAEAERERKEREALGHSSQKTADDAYGAGAPERGVIALRTAANALTANPTKKNEDAVLALIQQLMNWTRENSSSNDAKIRKLQGDLDQIKSREKHNRE